MTGFLDGIGDWLSTPNTPQQQKQQDFWTSLMRGGAAMMERSGPSRMPTSFGQVLGSGLGATSDYLDQRRAGRTQEEMQRLQIAAAKRKAEEEAKRQEMLKTASPEAQQAYTMGGAPGYAKYQEDQYKRRTQQDMMKSIFGPQQTQASQPMAPQQAPQRPPSPWPQGALPPPPAWPQTAQQQPPQQMPQQAPPQQTPQQQQAPQRAQQQPPQVVVPPVVVQPPMAPRSTMAPSAVNNMARAVNPDDIPATIREMVASGELPKDQVMAALSSKDPGTALNKLVNDYRRLAHVPAKREERYSYWRKEVDPYKKALEGYSQKLDIVHASLKEGTGTGDIAAINQYQRMIDDAVVRGEDVKLLTSAQGTLEMLKQRFEQVMNGTIYPPTLRAEIASAAQSFAEKVRQNNMGRLLGAKGMADPYIQRRWETKVVGKDTVDRYSKPFNIPTDEASYQHKADKTAQAVPEVVIKNDSDFRKLNRGQLYRGPDNVLRRK